MIPPHELKDLQVHEVSRLKDAGDDATLLSIAERLFYEVAHCRDIKAALDTEDLRPDEYRNEALVCALWISSIVKEFTYFPCRVCWGLSTDKAPPPHCTNAEAVRAIIDADMDKREANEAALKFVLGPGNDKTDPKLYASCIGRCLAVLAHDFVSAYKTAPVSVGVNTCDGEQAQTTTKMLIAMAKSCTAWKRSKDRYLFQQVKARLTACRIALLQYNESPMGSIADQLSYGETNKVIGKMITDDVGKLCTVANWKRSISIELFIIAISVLQEVLDVEIPLLINTEIPFHKTYDKPCFVVLSSNFGTRGTRFGFVWKETMWFVKSTENWPIPETILAWLMKSRDVTKSATLDSLYDAVAHPDTIVPSHKLGQFLH